MTDADASKASKSRKMSRNQVKPNTLLQQARERMPSRRHPGKCMSTGELAHALNAHIAEHGGTQEATHDHRSVGRYEKGTIRWPGERTRAAFRAVLGVSEDAELGFYSWIWQASPDVQVQEPPGTPSTRTPMSSSASVAQPPLPPAADVTVQDLVAASAVGASQFAARVHAGSVAEATLELYRTELAMAATDFVHRPVRELLPRLLSLWERISAHLRAGPRRHQSVDLYLLAGMTAVVLAHACHVLGRPREGMVHVRTATLCAEEAGHVELLAWTMATEALLVESGGRPRQALQLLADARHVLDRSSRPGATAVRLAAYRARFSSHLGDLEQTREAIGQAETADVARGNAADVSDLDDIGGILTFTSAKREFFIAEPYLRMGSHDEAACHAQLAITTYTLGPQEEFSYGDVALAHLIAATAQLAAGRLDAAVPSLHRVLELPVEQRIQPLRAPLTDIQRLLVTAKYRGALGAEDLRSAIGEFQRPLQGTIAG